MLDSFASLVWGLLHKHSGQASYTPSVVVVMLWRQNTHISIYSKKVEIHHYTGNSLYPIAGWQLLHYWVLAHPTPPPSICRRIWCRPYRLPGTGVFLIPIPTPLAPSSYGSIGLVTCTQLRNHRVTSFPTAAYHWSFASAFPYMLAPLLLANNIIHISCLSHDLMLILSHYSMDRNIHWSSM